MIILCWPVRNCVTENNSLIRTCWISHQFVSFTEQKITKMSDQEIKTGSKHEREEEEEEEKQDQEEEEG